MKKNVKQEYTEEGLAKAETMPLPIVDRKDGGERSLVGMKKGKDSGKAKGK